MEILSTITSLLSVGEMLISFKGYFNGKENRKYIIIWLEELANLVESVADDLQHGKYPHAKCAQMQFYLSSFNDLLKHDLSINQSKKLFELIEQAYQVERLLGELNNLTPKEKEYNISVMLGAAGTFRGLADFLKLKK